MLRSIKSFGLIALLTAGCSGPDEDTECDGELTLTLSSTPADVVASSLVVQGSVVTTRNTTVRSVNVAGVEAELSSFNFRTWTATVPFETLLALPESQDEPDRVVVPVEAVPACGEHAERSFEVRLNRRPQIAVTTLTLAPQFPVGPQFLPADGSAAALLTVTGNAEARGATVILRAAGEGGFTSGSETAVVLAGDGESASMAMTFITASAAGSISLTASALGTTSPPVKIDTAAAPRFFPPTAALVPGQTLIVLLETRVAAQKVAACSVQADPGLKVVQATDFSTFTLTAAEDLSEPVQATIDCHDHYGQSTQVSYTAAPKPPKP